jgi:hypothetical protein
MFPKARLPYAPSPAYKRPALFEAKEKLGDMLRFGGSSGMWG